MSYYGFIAVNQVRVGGESSRNSSITVGTTSVHVLRPNRLRKEATFTNDSDTAIYIAKADEATLNSGIRLSPYGGAAIILPDPTGRIYIGPVAAISSAATKNLCFTEDI